MYILKLSCYILAGVMLFSGNGYVSAQTGKCRKEIVIQHGDNLGKICYEHFGKFSNSLLRQILDLNPHIKDPNRIQAGDTLCLEREKETPKEPEQEGLKPKVKKTAKKAPEAQETREKQKELPQRKTKPSVVQKDAPHLFEKEDIPTYPMPQPGKISRLTWQSDNTAMVEGEVYSDSRCVFYVYVPGDLEYRQEGLEKPSPDTFRVKAIIGRRGRDYGKTFVLKLALFDQTGTRVAEIRRSIIRQPHAVDQVVWFGKDDTMTDDASITGWEGVNTWVRVQELEAMKSDNVAFQVPKGRLVVNYRYIGYNPDARYLSRYGRITLYGSSCMAKAYLFEGEIEKGTEILRPWCAQMTRDGRVPRSANVIGDNYISPDIRTGEVAHFLGALGLAQKLDPSPEWDRCIRTIVKEYIEPLTDPETGLVKGGYNGLGSEGYGNPYAYEKITWCSAEHNFDIFQALTLLTHVYAGTDFSTHCYQLSWKIGGGIDQYLWDEDEGTFNRGWRPEGPDAARALDCSSWGALYLLKQAGLAGVRGDEPMRKHYIAMAKRCLEYAEKHFRTLWHYRTPGGRNGTIEGYRPYDGLISDLRHEDGPFAGEMIDWDKMNKMVWSEGTLGVALAWEEFGRLTDDEYAGKRAREIYHQMRNLQGLSDKGGMLYSTKQIKGHFTMGEELASLGWLGYLLSIQESGMSSHKQSLIKWMVW